MHHRWSKAPGYTNERYLKIPQRRHKIAILKKIISTAQGKILKLKAKINAIMEQNGDVVEENLQSDLIKIMKENSLTIQNTYPEGSFARLFWEEQLKAATVTNARQIRWHPMIIKWCLNLKLSSSAYYAMRSSGFVKLPSERTLRDYTHYFTHRTGFQNDVDKQLASEINQLSLSDAKRFVALSFDEMKIKEGLVYNKHSGEIIGYTDLGGINDEL